jgi:hypothetical protein
MLNILGIEQINHIKIQIGKWVVRIIVNSG